ncbi:unnamed protein product, partial [Rotaria sordida]
MQREKAILQKIGAISQWKESILLELSHRMIFQSSSLCWPSSLGLL